MSDEIMKAKCIMVQGTASSVGKSVIATGLCRVFKQDGYRVAPFKSQNMALNSYITAEGKEMGRAQVVQAEAAEIEPTVDMNPILLKPTTDQNAQIIINGEVHRNMSAAEYHLFKPELAEMVENTYHKLAENYDIIVIEGAGSPAEINLRDRDIVNMGMAEIADAPVILVGDIDKGGVFASLTGTMFLLTENERQRVKGMIINKFRGDLNILKPGLTMIEEIVNLPVLGVLPYLKLNIDDEDSLTEKFIRSNRIVQNELDVVVIKLPHIANFTDFNVLESVHGANVRYIDQFSEIQKPDLILLPGSKNTIEDLLYIRSTGIEAEIKRLHKEGTIIFGICGGYQMLGERIEDPEMTESALLSVTGMGLLATQTIFERKKVTTQVRGRISDNYGLMEGLAKIEIHGYEIHMGRTTYDEKCTPFLAINRVLNENTTAVGGVKNKEGTVFGTYLHGIFDNMAFTVGFLNNLRKYRGLKKTPDNETTLKEFKNLQYDKLADMLRENLDMKSIYQIMGLPVK
jgi:adenosylcobyric acid synthase